MRTLHFRPRKAWLLFLAIAVGTDWAARADDWPQWLGPRRDGIWRETGILKKFPAGGLKYRWRTPIKSGYAGPAVAEGRVYVTDRLLPSQVTNPSNPFEASPVPGRERVLCLSEADGRILWQHEYECRYNLSYPAGPRATPLVARDRVYTLGAEGHLICLDTETGRVIWQRDFKKDFRAKTPLWGFAAHPLLDGSRLICLVGGEQSAVVAFHKDTGEELWRALDVRELGYCPPMIYEAGGRRQLIVWHPQSLNSLDPESGRVYWSEPFESKAGLTISTPRMLGNRLFVTAFYNGPLMMQMAPDAPKATVQWRGKSSSEQRTDGLHSIISTPFLEAGHIYGVCSYGQLRCLKADTGERVWSTLQATTAQGKETRWANAFLVKQDDRFFLANELGELIVARLTPEGYAEVSRVPMLEPTNKDPGRWVVWSHPAFANRCIYARNDKEMICASLAEPQP